MNLPEPLLENLAKAKASYDKLSSRERYAVIGCGIFLLCYGLYSLYAPIARSFDLQSRQIAKLETDLDSAAIVLKRYAELKSRLQMAEKKFKKSGQAEGVQSYLENLLMNQVHISKDRFSINPGARLTLGTSYVQYPFAVKFDTTNLQDAVKFLEEVQFGPNKTPAGEPLLVTKLEINKSRRNDKLTVTVGVSSVSNAS